MRIYTIRIGCGLGREDVNGVQVGCVTLEGVRIYDAEAAHAFGMEIAGGLYGWTGPGMNVSVIQTGEENRR